MTHALRTRLIGLEWERESRVVEGQSEATRGQTAVSRSARVKWQLRPTTRRLHPQSITVQTKPPHTALQRRAIQRPGHHLQESGGTRLLDRGHA